MPPSHNPYESSPPSGRRLAAAVAMALAGAVVVLVTTVMPAEYGLDPTGVGRLLGLDALKKPTRRLQIRDVVGGNESYRAVRVPDPRTPVPLPNPAVAQIKTAAARTEQRRITLQPGQETEIKALLDEAQVILYTWHAEGGPVYTDFHGHEPDAGDAFVRFEETQATTDGHGSLVAPFSGEHGWFWLNVSEQPVTITLQITGYPRGIKDYGVIKP